MDYCHVGKSSHHLFLPLQLCYQDEKGVSVKGCHQTPACFIPSSLYSVEFTILARTSGWNKESLQRVFLNGLSDQVKDELAARDEPDTLDSISVSAVERRQFAFLL